MKRFVLPMLLMAATASHAQLSLKSIFSKAKAELEDKVSKHVNRIIEEGADALDEKAARVSIVSTKVKAAPVTSTSNKATKAIPVFRADTASMAPPAEVDRYLSRTFPNFYRAYAAETDSDPLIQEVQFGYREGHKISCSANSGKGSIFFELFYFEKRETPRAEALYTYEFYVMQGLLHAGTKKPKDRAEKWRLAFEFAYQKAKASAENGYCLPLIVAVNTTKLNMDRKQAAPLTGKALEKYNGQKMAYGSEAYKQCAAWVAANPELCKMPATPTKKQ